MKKLSIFYVERPNPVDPNGSAHSYLALIDESSGDTLTRQHLIKDRYESKEIKRRNAKSAKVEMFQIHFTQAPTTETEKGGYLQYEFEYGARSLINNEIFAIIGGDEDFILPIWEMMREHAVELEDLKLPYECKDDPNALNCRAFAMAVIKRVMYLINERDYEIPDDPSKDYSKKGRAASDSWILYRGLD